MSSIVYRSTLTGVLKRVAVVVLLGLVGLTAGVAYGTLFSSNEFGATIVLPAESSYTFPSRYDSAPDLMREMRGLHPGVHLVAHGGSVIDLSVTGSVSDKSRARGFSDKDLVCAFWNERHRPSVCDDDTARRLALHRSVSMVMLDQAPGRKFKVMWHGTAGRLPYGLFGLLAGMSAALGFLVPPRSSVTAKRRDGSRAAGLFVSSS